MLAALLFAETRRVAELQHQLIAQQQQSQAERDEAARGQAELQKRVAELKEVISQFEARGKQIAGDGTPSDDAAGGETSAGEGKKAKEGFAGMMEKMFTDPAMKKMMRSQQAMGVRMMYSDLAKELGLSPDEANQIMDMLVDRQMAMARKSMKLLGGEQADGATAEEAGQDVNAAKEDYDKQLEGALGKDRFAKMQEYERTIGDRMQLTQYKQAFSASGVALEDRQAEGLLTIMKDERLKQPPSPLDAGAKDVGAAMKAMQSDETFDALMASQEDLNRRVLSRSRNVLTPDQMAQFEQIQKQNLEMQKMGMQMGRQMMKGK